MINFVKFKILSKTKIIKKLTQFRNIKNLINFKKLIKNLIKFKISQKLRILTFNIKLAF